MTTPVRCLLFLSALSFAQTTVTVTSVQNGASFTSQITPGGFVTIKGMNFTTAPMSSTAIPVPDILGSVSVTVAGLPCPIYYVNPTQINLLLPWKTPIGSYPLIVTANGQTVGPVNINIVSEAPGIFQYGANRVVAQNVNNNYALNSSTAPAAVGSTIAVYVTGIGQVSNTPVDGDYSPGQPFAQAVFLSSATIGGVNAPITFLGLTPGSIGLAQANITVPNLPSGNYPPHPQYFRHPKHLRINKRHRLRHHSAPALEPSRIRLRSYVSAGRPLAITHNRRHRASRSLRQLRIPVRRQRHRHHRRNYSLRAQVSFQFWTDRCKRSRHRLPNL